VEAAEVRRLATVLLSGQGWGATSSSYWVAGARGAPPLAPRRFAPTTRAATASTRNLRSIRACLLTGELGEVCVGRVEEVASEPHVVMRRSATYCDCARVIGSTACRGWT
jgi:hypothetical protein